MKKTSSEVVKFFKSLEKNSNNLDLNGLSSQYADMFMFADSSGTRIIKKEDFLKVLPNRKKFVDKVGLKFVRYTTLEETRLDNYHTMVEAHIIMHFEKDNDKQIEDEDSSTYILERKNDRLQIILHIEHGNLTEKLKNLGLLES